MDYQYNGINNILNNFTLSNIYIIVKHNNLPCTTNPARGAVSQPQRHNQPRPVPPVIIPGGNQPSTTVPNLNIPPEPPMEIQKSPRNKRSKDDGEGTSKCQ
ncbi:unnamed protein product [Amaranthus hypochondriacus]